MQEGHVTPAKKKKKKRDCSITRRGQGSERSKLKYRKNEFRKQQGKKKRLSQRTNHELRNACNKDIDRYRFQINLTLGGKNLFQQR